MSEDRASVTVLVAWLIALPVFGVTVGFAVATRTAWLLLAWVGYGYLVLLPLSVYAGRTMDARGERGIQTTLIVMVFPVAGAIWWQSHRRRKALIRAAPTLGRVWLATVGGLLAAFAAVIGLVRVIRLVT